MKPLRLEMQAFGPYPGHEVVDFVNLSQNGIFLIKGPTGSGKTTIFDAISMSLYGKSTVEEDKVKGGRNNLEMWRCNQADWETETIIDFTFLAGDKEYQFIRRLVPKRTKLDPVYAINVKDENGVFQALDGYTRDGELNAKAEEIIGLNSSQFRQVVLLPQGKFERFLTADATEKEQILCRLFDASEWEKYAKNFYDRIESERSELLSEKQEVDIALKSENAELTGVESLGSFVEGLKEELKDLEKAHREFDSSKRRKALDEDKQTYEKFKRLHELEAAKVTLEEEAVQIDEKREKFEKANKAEDLREGIRKVEELKSEYDLRNKKLQELNDKTPDYEKAEQDSRNNLDTHSNNSPIDEYNSRIGMLQSKKELYESIDALKEEKLLAEKDFSSAEKLFREKADLMEKAKKAAAEKLEEYNKAEEHAREYRNRYFADIYGEIAGSLVKGTPCPVCGSIEHPTPAPKATDSITKDMLEKAEADASDKKELWNASEQLRNDAETECNAQKEKYDAAFNKKNNSETRYEEAAKNLIEGILSTEDLLLEIDNIKAEIEAYNRKTSQLTEEYNIKHDELQTHKEKISTLIGECESVGENCKKEMDVLNALLLQKGYSDIDDAKKDMLSDSQKHDILEVIASYDTRIESNKEEIKKQKEAVKKLKEPDAEKFAERQNEIDEELKGYERDSSLLTKDIERLSVKYTDLNKKIKHYTENIFRVDSDMAFARKLRGDTGIGLQRYVLGIMFNQIIAEANRMLQMVHSGRYHLIRTDDKGSGNKRGLELLVHDNRNPDVKGRPVSSLSGGEKFLVSLSLSIGMSAVAQKSGLQIEALFIDEGFGTLDENSISNAMDILECVQKNSGMIGIISHVSVLENNIPKHLEIVKTEKGSRIKSC